MHDIIGMPGADAQPDTDATDAVAAHALPWPPPGLEPLHGSLWRAARLLLAGGVLAIGPLLASIAIVRPFWAPPLFSDSLILAGTLVLAGIVLLLLGADCLARAALTGARAGRAGYPAGLMLRVAADRSRDAGLVLEGRRHYARLNSRERDWLLGVRTAAAVLRCAGALWVPVGFGVAVVAAARGLLASGSGLAAVTFGPALVCLLVGTAFQAMDAVLTRNARRARDGGGAPSLRAEAAAWRHALEQRAGAPLPPPASGASLRVAGWAAIGLGVVLPLPLLGLVALAGAGMVPTLLGDADLAGATSRMARIHAVEPWLLPPDPGVTAAQAGQALHALSVAGRGDARPRHAEQPPVRAYAPITTVTGTPPAALPSPDRLAASGSLARAWQGGLSDEEVAWLADVADHPALAEFAVAGRAAMADLAGTRWDAPALAGIPYWDLPAVHVGGLRTAAHAHFARAVLQAARGDEQGAETTLREILGTGALLARDAAGLLDLLAGSLLVDVATAGLVELYEATGRTGDARALTTAHAAAESSAALVRTLRRHAPGAASLQAPMSLAGDASLPRGVRWEALHTVNLTVACNNPHVALFGPGEDYDDWLEAARAGLVRHPGDALLFDAVTAPLQVPEEYRRRTARFSRVTGLVLPGSHAADCAALLTLLTSAL